MNSDKKNVVLTGASRGIGHATVKKFSETGWRVLTCSRQPFDERCPWPEAVKIIFRSIFPIPIKPLKQLKKLKVN